MNHALPCVTVWRVVLEAQTALSISTGCGDGVNDVVLAQDANGLPMLPASAVAGVLRQAWAANHGDAVAKALFGFSEGDRGQASRLSISHGHIHDRHNKAVLYLDDRAEGDALLRPLLSRRPTLRQRVRINHRGAADHQGLFDRSVLPPGHRFSLEILLWSSTPEEGDQDGQALEQILATEGLRLGALTRSGLGRLTVSRCHRAQFDLRKPEGLAAFSKLDRAIDSIAGLKPYTLPAPVRDKSKRPTLTIRLSPEAGFRFGGGVRSIQRPQATQPGQGRQPRLAQDLPASEPCVLWPDQDGSSHGQLSAIDQVLIPATGLKGPLSHRTAFYENCRRSLGADNWRDGLGGIKPEQTYDKALHSQAVRALFGWSPEGKERDQQGQAGVLWWSDLHLAPETVSPQTQWHNSIDRFTGGVRDGLLYAAENLHAANRQTPLLEIRITLDLERARAVGLTTDMLRDFEYAVDDLCQGRLALGADAAGGQGFFKGAQSWDHSPHDALAGQAVALKGSTAP